MLLQEPDVSPYDLHLRILGYDVRVAWTFWLGAAFFGFGLAQAVVRWFPGETPGVVPMLMLASLAILLSITIHELGHAFAFSAAGVPSRIVLYHFGGLAIPGSVGGGSWNATRSVAPPRLRPGPWTDVIIAAAGPALQLAFAAVVAGGLRVAGYHVDGLWMMSSSLDAWVNEGATNYLSPIMRGWVMFLMFPSIGWAALNLTPVYPLDGGQIMKGFVEAFGGNASIWLWISVVAGAAAAFYGFTGGHYFVGFLFGSMAVTNYQSLQRSGLV